MMLIQYPQERCDIEITKKIIELESTAWPDDGENEDFPSAPDTHISSFILLEGDTAVCHVGVRKSILSLKGQTYQAYGLSEVVTHPHYQKKGIASKMIKIAARFIVEQNADISVFTCEKNKIAFYRSGGWEEMKGTCFVGGTNKKPFRSDSLNLATMMMFISPKGKRHRADFENTDLIFELGENQLW